MEASKKILFISYDGMTDPLGQSQVIPYLSNLTKFGYTFTILSCDKADKYANSEVGRKELDDARKGKSYSYEEFLSEVKLRRKLRNNL